MTVLEEVGWEECPLPPLRDRELEGEVRRAQGFVPSYVPYIAHCPWLVRAVIRSFVNGGLAHLDVRFAELVFLAVSRENSCRFCYASQRLLLRVLGLGEEEVRRLEERSYVAQDDEAQRLALDFARRISRANPVPPPADRAALREAGWSEEEIAELAYVATFAAGANRVTTFASIPLAPLERLGRWYVRPVWPFVARAMRSRRRRGAPEPLAPDERTGVFSHAVLQLDGLPSARNLRSELDSAWDSSLLPQRAKALVFAVVARGVGCRRSEAEARRLLAERGLEEKEVDEVLGHLTSPALDAVEAAVVPFARETIWYRPEEIQRRARTLLETLGPAAFVELVGTASLANNVCRLSVALDGA